MLDPFMLLKLPLMAMRFWLRVVGPKWIIAGMGASTLGVLLYACSEGR